MAIKDSLAFIVYAGAYLFLVIVIGIYVYFRRKSKPRITPEELERTYIEQVWFAREIYTAAIVHVYDQGTDIAIMIQWYELLQLEASGTNIESVDMYSFFVAGISFIMLYRIIAMVFAFYEDTHTTSDQQMVYHDGDKEVVKRKSIWIIMWDLVLALFDLYFVKIIYKEFETGELKPNTTHRSLQLCEALFESMPQVVLQSVFLLRYTVHLPSGSNALVLNIVSIVASILSIANKYSWFDRQAVVWDAKTLNGGRKGECYISWRFLLRNLWRWSDLCVRFVILTLLWVAIGGLYILIYICLSYLFYYFVVFNRIEMKEGNHWYRLLATTICIVGVILDYEPHFCILRVIDNGIMLAIVSIFVFTTFDCSDIYCSDNNQRDALNTPVILDFIVAGFVAYFIEVVTYPILQDRNLEIIKKALQGRQFFSIILFGDDTEEYYLTYYVDNSAQREGTHAGMRCADIEYFIGHKSNEECEKLAEEIEVAVKSVNARKSAMDLNDDNKKKKTGDIAIDMRGTKVFKYGICIKCLHSVYNIDSEEEAEHFIKNIYNNPETMKRMEQIFDAHFRGRDKSRKWVLEFAIDIDTQDTTFIALNSSNSTSNIVLKYRFGHVLRKYTRDIRIINGHDYDDIHDGEKQVAIKVIDIVRTSSGDVISSSKRNRDVFERERMCLEILNKNKGDRQDVLPYIGWDEADDAYFVVTKRVFGAKIVDKVTGEGGVHSRTLVQYIRKMFSYMSYVHSQNIAMRNISLNSFQFAMDDDTDTAVEDSIMYLVHYENSLYIPSRDAMYGNIQQKAVYLSPELCDIVLDRYRHKKWQRNIKGAMFFASDVWSLGILTYYLILGKHPFYRSGASANKLKKTLNNIVKHTSFEALTPFKYSENNVVFTEFINGALCRDYEQRWTIDKCLSHEFLSETFIDNLDDTEIMKQEIIDVLKGNMTQTKLRDAIAKVRAEQIETKERRLELKKEENDNIENIEKTETEIDKLFDVADEDNIKQQFKRIDLDGDGYTTVAELTLLLSSLGYALNFAQKEAQIIMNTLDLDGDGTIDFNEFAQAWVKRKLNINDKYAHAIFNVFDENGDGFISMNELKCALFDTKDSNDEKDDDDDSEEDAPLLDKFFKSIEEERKNDQLLQILSEVDNNKDGKISFEEFHEALKNDMDKSKDEKHYGNMPFINIFNDISFKEINEDGKDTLFENEADYITPQLDVNEDKRQSQVVVDIKNEPDETAERVKTPSRSKD